MSGRIRVSGEWAVVTAAGEDPPDPARVAAVRVDGQADRVGRVRDAEAGDRPAWDAWQAERGEISQRPGYADNPFRPR
jgi:hypothetical protein